MISQANAKFDLTTGSSWEGGVKGTRLDDRVDLTASVFRIQQDDILTRDENNPALTIQGGSQLVRGTELSASAAVTSELRIDGNFALLDAEFTKLLEAGGVSRAGNTPPDVPERTANAWVTYRLRGLPLTISGGVRYRGRLFINNANSGEMKGFTLLDASGSWQLGRGELTLRGRNLTDVLYADRTGSGTSQVLLGPPRSVDLTWTTRF